MAQKEKGSKRLEKNPQTTQKLFDTVGYTIGTCIGTGTYSKVYIATNKSGQKFACKVIQKKNAGTDFIDRFLPRELEVLSSIKHPNIVGLHKSLEINNTIYMFMDYCKHGDLLDHIRKNGAFTEEKAKVFFRQIADAVFYLHGMEIAHRDIKCENILLVSENQIKLADFGFARSCRDKYNKLVLSDTFCGSAAYAAPEILQGISYDPKKYDIWAMGCVLYIMISSSMPFDDSNVRKMIKAQISRSIAAVTILWPERTSDLKKLINHLLEPDITKRYSIKEVATSAWLEGSGGFAKFKRLITFVESAAN